MKKIFIILIIISGCSLLCKVRADELRYNIHEGKYEYAEPDSKLEYNIHEGTYEYTNKDDRLEYNSHEHEYQYNDNEGSDTSIDCD